jgi:hypothetical protein
MGVRGWRKIGRGKDAWKLILKVRVLYGPYSQRRERERGWRGGRGFKVHQLLLLFLQPKDKCPNVRFSWNSAQIGAEYEVKCMCVYSVFITYM